jgi:uncharacterized OsmC-like protein
MYVSCKKYRINGFTSVKITTDGKKKADHNNRFFTGNVHLSYKV